MEGVAVALRGTVWISRSWGKTVTLKRDAKGWNSLIRSRDPCGRYSKDLSNEASWTDCHKSDDSFVLSERRKRRDEEAGISAGAPRPCDGIQTNTQEVLGIDSKCDMGAKFSRILVMACITDFFGRLGITMPPLIPLQWLDDEGGLDTATMSVSGFSTHRPGGQEDRHGLCRSRAVKPAAFCHCPICVATVKHQLVSDIHLVIICALIVSPGRLG